MPCLTTLRVLRVINSITRDLKRVDGIIQNMRSKAGEEHVFQDSDFRTFLSCVDSMRRVCDVLRVCNRLAYQ